MLSVKHFVECSKTHLLHQDSGAVVSSDLIGSNRTTHNCHQLIQMTLNPDWCKVAHVCDIRLLPNELQINETKTEKPEQQQGEIIQTVLTFL